jgi:hypothetical protein
VVRKLPRWRLARGSWEKHGTEGPADASVAGDTRWLCWSRKVASGKGKIITLLITVNLGLLFCWLFAVILLDKET